MDYISLHRDDIESSYIQEHWEDFTDAFRTETKEGNKRILDSYLNCGYKPRRKQLKNAEYKIGVYRETIEHIICSRIIRKELHYKISIADTEEIDSLLDELIYWRNRQYIEEVRKKILIVELIDEYIRISKRNPNKRTKFQEWKHIEIGYILNIGKEPKKQLIYPCFEMWLEKQKKHENKAKSRHYLQ